MTRGERRVEKRRRDRGTRWRHAQNSTSWRTKQWIETIECVGASFLIDLCLPGCGWRRALACLIWPCNRQTKNGFEVKWTSDQARGRFRNCPNSSIATTQNIGGDFHNSVCHLSLHFHDRLIYKTSAVRARERHLQMTELAC